MADSSTQPLRVVLANVVVASLLWSRPPRRLLVAAIDGEVELFSSAVLLEELANTLGHSKFAVRIESFGTSIAALVAQYTALVSLVAPASVPRVMSNDADDDHVIAAAVAARAELIVTGDRKRLLPNGSHQGIAIVTAREVTERLFRKKQDLTPAPLERGNLPCTLCRQKTLSQLILGDNSNNPLIRLIYLPVVIPDGSFNFLQSDIQSFPWTKPKISGKVLQPNFMRFPRRAIERALARHSGLES